MIPRRVLATQPAVTALWQETVQAVELDEARRRHGPHPPQAVRLLLVQDDMFRALGPAAWTRRPLALSWPVSDDGPRG
jgi:hypothetical protein